MTHARLWKFRPADGRAEDFAAAYGSAGVWAQLFGRAAGYRGTQLLRPAEDDGWWLTIDRWVTKQDFEAFQDQFGEEYRALDAELESLCCEEQLVGTFEED